MTEIKMLNLNIDGKPVSVAAGTNVLEAAKQLDLDIPRLCYDPELTSVGACRLCIVEIEKMRGLPASCATPVAEGMVVRTNTEKIRKYRKMTLELLLANHPQDCLTCEKNGDCKLQEYAYIYGARQDTYAGERKHFKPDDTNAFFIRDHDKCIVCGRCIRTCAESMGVGAVDYAWRGFKAKVATSYDVPLEESPCVFCGNCVTVCPTGALQPRTRIGQGRPWELRRARTVCPYCGVGCRFELLFNKEGRIVGVEPADGPANHNKLCVKGRFGWEFIQSPDRLTRPLVRKGVLEGQTGQAGRDSEFVEVSWDEALDLIARRFTELKKTGGPGTLAGLSSAKCTNEENYLMQRLVRQGFGTNNIDHCARLCHASTVAGLALSFGSGAMTNSIDDIAQSDCVFVIGSNTTEAHPVIGMQVKKAKRNGAKLIVVDPRRVDLAELADLHLQQIPGSDVALLNGLMHVILREDLYDKGFVESRTENFEALKTAVEKFTPEYVESLCGVPAGLIVEAARAYAKAGRAAIIYSMGITQHTTGTDNVQTVANLAMLTGNIGREGTGVNPLRGQNNVQGACDVGALPNVFPGYQAVTNPDLKAKFEKAWGARLDDKVGLTVTEIMNAAAHGDLKGLYIMGENPMVSDPDLRHVEEALGHLDFLVVQDIFLTETAKLADVVLPGACFAEKDGTFTNTERRVQLFRTATAAPGEARPDWQILRDVGRRLGLDWNYNSVAEVMDEVADLTPIYGGVRWDRLAEGGDAFNKGLQWPVPNREHPGTPVLHREKFSRGLGQFATIDYRPAAEGTDAEYPLVLSTGRILYHYHTGTMTRRSKGLNWIRPEGYIEVNPETAADYGLEDHAWVKVTSRRGSVVTRVKVTGMTGRRVVFMPFHFAEAAANVLTNPAVDPRAKIPEFKVAAVKLEKAEAPAWAVEKAAAQSAAGEGQAAAKQVAAAGGGRR
jgi:formate dehydrogenase alpha subunit